MVKIIRSRLICLLLAGIITFSSVAISYHQSVECAEWVAGAVASVSGGPLLTALLVGGVVVAGGIALYEFLQTDEEDYQEFNDELKDGFNEYVKAAEKTRIMENDINKTEADALVEATQKAGEICNGFWDTCVKVGKTTTGYLTKEMMDYWKLYSNIVGDVADNPLIEDSSDITDTTPILVPVIGSSNTTTTGKSNIGSNTFELNNYRYLLNGDYYIYGRSWTTNIENSDGVSYIPFVVLNEYDHIETIWRVMVTSQGEFVGRLNQDFGEWTDQGVNTILDNTSLPVVFINSDGSNNDWQDAILNNWRTALAVGMGAINVNIWVRKANNAMNKTHAGKAISTGRRQLVNEGDEITSVFVSDSYPIKRSSVKDGVIDEVGVYEGDLGWDIPNDDVWDGVINGDTPWPRVIDDTGTMSWPKSADLDDTDGSMAIPQDTPIDVPGETDENTPQEEKPTAKDEIEKEGGTFSPTAMDLTDVFPFCIPFDIYYLVTQFNVTPEVPEITIPIVYPQAIQSAMGTDRYDIVIDFNDFVVVRNVIRIFLLILFIAGLMKLTRDIIRG